MRKAKIIATLGPSSSSVEQISKLIFAGFNAARINMSHGIHEEHGKIIDNVREASKKMGWEVAVLMDLQGPKLRVGKLKSPLSLKKGDIWDIGYEKNSTGEKFIPTLYKHLVDDCRNGARILFDDGLIVAEAMKRKGDVYQIEIKHGGVLKSNKGINLPDCMVSAASFTNKDRADLEFGLTKDIDYVALSFIRNKDDILEVKKFLKERKKNIPVIAKIENSRAVENIKEIIESTDFIMLARGDLGVEMGNHLVPSIQKKIINLCNNMKTPVITATQMLESMINNPTPTRAEANDVANAIWDGSDAVMLSGETAVGDHPEKVIQIMVKIIIEAEKNSKDNSPLRKMDLSSVDDAIMVAASLVAEKVGASRIVSMTQSGNSCKKLADCRPMIRILGVTNSLIVVRRMCLLWGVTPFFLKDKNIKIRGFHQDILPDILDRVREDCKLVKGDKIVVTRGEGKYFKEGIGTSNSISVRVL